MSLRIPQINFSKGEIGPHLYGRFDVDAWRAGLKQAVNVVVLKYGGLDKRPGTRLVAEVLDSSEETRLVPFSYSLEQSYALELGQGYASPCAFGGRVVEEELDITAMTTGATTQITALYHGYEAGDVVFLTGIEGDLGDALNGRYWTVLTDDGTDVFTIDADTTGLSFEGSEGGITRDEEPTPPTPPTVPDPVDPTDPPTTPPGGGGGWNPDDPGGVLD